MRVTGLFYGIGGSSERGWLGWSTVVLIQDNGRNLLFDTGAFNDRPGLLMKLADHHLSPDDIDSVIISHLHFDHIGNIDLFKKAKWYIHQEEIEESGKPGDPVPEPYRLWILRQPNLIVVRKPRMGIMSGIEMIHTPGHTKGSCSLLAVYDKKRILLCADAIKSREDILGTPFYLSSLGRMVGIVDYIIPGHDCPLLPDGTPFADNINTVHWIKTNAPLEVCNYGTNGKYKV